jgi:homocysteine S-methyltransferase
MSATQAAESPAAWPHEGRFMVIAGVRAPRGQNIAQFIARASELVSAGADLLAVTGQETSAARVSPVAAAAVLRERASADVIITMEGAGRSLAGLQADLLGGHALGVQTVVCRSGTPWVAGDYPQPYSPGEVDSVRLVAALAGLNDRVDWRGVATPYRTRFVIGACVHTAAADMRHELAWSKAKAEAGAHFLVTDRIHDADAARRLLGELRGHGVELPVLAVFAPFGEARSITRLMHEVPGTVPASSVAAASATSGWKPADPVSAVRESIAGLRELIAGVIIHAPGEPDDRMTDLVTELAISRQAS